MIHGSGGFEIVLSRKEQGSRGKINYTDINRLCGGKTTIKPDSTGLSGNL
jgi:hypothetical protein